ncbi:MAG: hypothetical protein PGN13_04880 [Patulibacter minatonensis]
MKRQQYARWLGDAENFCLVARSRDGAAIGGAVVKLDGPSSIWPTDRSGELDTLTGDD